MEPKREITVSFTGNRVLTSPTPKSSESLDRELRERLFGVLESLYARGFRRFCSGMAVGWDMLAAEEVLRLKASHDDVELIAVVPFRGQEERFLEIDQRRYYDVCRRADRCVVISEAESIEAYHERNDYLIAVASVIIAYHNGKTRSGAGSTLRKAMARGVEVLNLYDGVGQGVLF